MEEHLEQVPTVRSKRSSNISSIIGQLRGWTICPTALGRGGKKHCALQPLQDPVVLVSQAANLHLGGAGLTSFNVVFLLQICKT